MAGQGVRVTVHRPLVDRLTLSTTYSGVTPLVVGSNDSHRCPGLQTSDIGVVHYGCFHDRMGSLLCQPEDLRCLTTTTALLTHQRSRARAVLLALRGFAPSLQFRFVRFHARQPNFGCVHSQFKGQSLKETELHCWRFCVVRRIGCSAGAGLHTCYSSISPQMDCP